MNKFLIALVLLLSVAVARNYRQDFSAWVKKYGKTYSVAEMQMRFQVWKKKTKSMLIHGTNVTPAPNSK